ncbi:Hsp20/alpha crystallin family protein [Marinibactrum halimedae]|uniref:SHSP domain-containing protein n=1 Tax=Marinibactrum halimedae TaxID=1444977 RepID=A0AA37T4E1_9GAMM|nr:Hsp20/alpha crystallin family protein [Marinibactrum halimedae]MCD9457729.1 Hsp20/alpha crystallin family protein [Marinibactrum halimedae]GLS24898.1 hypothetical protein GCM10007877_06120 [Marinibactrum halimedae]
MNIIPRNSLFDFDNLFDHFLHPRRESFGGAAADVFSPRVDIKETQNQYLLHAELPGVKKEDLDVTLDAGVLTISAKVSSESKEEKDEVIIRRERHFGQFWRSFNLGGNVSESDIVAKFSDGVLTLEVPKIKNTEPERKRIEIN